MTKLWGKVRTDKNALTLWIKKQIPLFIMAYLQERRQSLYKHFIFAKIQVLQKEHNE